MDVATSQGLLSTAARDFIARRHKLLIDGQWVDARSGKTFAVFGPSNGQQIPISAPGEWHAYSIREPVGMVGQIIPWNFPLLMAVWKIAPALAADDADLDQAVDAAAFGAFKNQGQICMSTERLVVDESVADAFVAKLAAKAAHLPAGDPRGHVVQGSLIDQSAAVRMEELIADAVGKGAVVVAGGKREGSVFHATILDRVTPDMRIYGEESFEPVKPVVRVRGVDDAVCVANDTKYGQSAAVFGRDVTRALAVSRRLETGICHINRPTVADEAQMPFGGVKASGYGRFGGKTVIGEFTNLRWITIEGPQHYPF